MPEMDEAQLRKLLGDKKVDEIIAYGKQLKAEGKNPDQIARVLLALYPDLPARANAVGGKYW